MLLKFKILVIGGIAAVALTAAPAGQSDPPFQCPPGGGWFLSPPSPGDVFFDKNGNGLICVKPVNGQGSSRDVPGFTVKDDLG